ncbi:cobalt ECF transporter T component CbiQ [Anaeromyxobacter diazotrophicus]|uniref:Cobalt ECF transporter T component CbiQ n=1 Tax=Anaeromyxobacter diazotrophicus TaxID=2590199 RepID=A0A7I9VH67_9BACT|nr:cobalt ECF transporter T component CbiQ [Anaeromyxobacter diazotrophicus]GEJ55685.1 cobalt ECF transporter T component CbiQ [Anaeromyxobacter diazotrophicus]
MSAAGPALAHLGALDGLAARDTPAARLDPRVKTLAAIAYVAVVASFGRGDALRLVPLAAWPVALGALGDVPWRPVLLRLALASPFALGVAAFEPLLDRAPALAVAGVTVSAGTVAFATILLKFALALSGALVLVATTGFDAMCAGLERLGAPRLLVAQLLLLYRYLFVLSEEAARLWRAHALRSPDRPRPTARLGATLLGQLLLRTLARGERLHAAMRCRGFDGTVKLVRRARLSRADLAFGAATAALLAGCRFGHLPAALQRLL